MASQETVKYQKMLEEVETVIKEISSGDVDLDQLVSKVERGYSLINQMKERLETTKEKIERLRLDQTDAPTDAETAPSS